MIVRGSWRLVVVLGLLAGTAIAQPRTRQNLAEILGFENGRAGKFPAGWSGPAGDIVTDDQVVHSGKYSARIERTPSNPAPLSSVTSAISMDFGGKTVEWRGFIKTENVENAVALWLREDGDTSVLAFSSMQSLKINGTRDWKEYTVNIPVVPGGKKLTVGFLLAGPGKAWVDDLQVLVDGKPVAQAPERLETVFDTDREFDTGSRVKIDSLSALQVKNLATLAKVWGFLKYHHPAITSGGRHWDYDLFRVLPPMLGALNLTAANKILSEWVDSLGPVPACSDCAPAPDAGTYLLPDLAWISDEKLLGAELSRKLRNIHRNRGIATSQFYVSLFPVVLNPNVEMERSYASIQQPDAGYQLLALFRFWNIIQYFYPNRDVMAGNGSPNYWTGVLEQFIPPLAFVKDSGSYRRELMKFIAKINDTHANLWSSMAVRPPVGACQFPVEVRFVEGQAVVTRNISRTPDPDPVLKVGDIIETLDGVKVADRVAEWSPFYADSNEAARLRDIAHNLTKGACGPAPVSVRRAGKALQLTTERVPESRLDLDAGARHDLPGLAFQKLSDDVAYLKLSSVKISDSANYIAAAMGTKGLIIDVRNYPAEFVVFTLGSLLISTPVDFVRFTTGDLTNPGAFHWATPLQLTPAEPHYRGKVVILVDETTQSQAEYTAMALRAVPGAVVIGSTTAGADGNVSTVPLPGGLSSAISGIGVFYPDKRPTQRVGIVPDIEVRPTIEGIRAGTDELIEAAKRVIAGELRPKGKKREP